MSIVQHLSKGHDVMAAWSSHMSCHEGYQNMLPWALQEVDTQLRAARLREAEQETQLEAAQDLAKQSAEQATQLQQVLHYCEDNCRCSKQHSCETLHLQYASLLAGTADVIRRAQLFARRGYRPSALPDVLHCPIPGVGGGECRA